MLFSQLYVFFLVVTTFRSLSDMSRICQSLLFFLLFSYSLLLQSRFCQYRVPLVKSIRNLGIIKLRKDNWVFFSLPLFSLSPSLSLHNFLFGLLAEDDGRQSQELFIYLLLYNPGRLFSLSQCCVCGMDRCLMACSRVLVHVVTASASWCIVFLRAIWTETQKHKPEVTWLIVSWVPHIKWGGYLAEECICSAARMWPAHAPWRGDYKILWNKYS